MPSPHPPLTGPWLDIGAILLMNGPTPRVPLRHAVSLSNKGFKTHSKLMKLRGLIDVKGGVVSITPLGAMRVNQTLKERGK